MKQELSVSNIKNLITESRFSAFNEAINTEESLNEAVMYLQRHESEIPQSTTLLGARVIVASKIFNHMANAQNDADYQRFYGKFSELYHHNQAEIKKALGVRLKIEASKPITKKLLQNLFKIITFVLEEKSTLGASSSQPLDSSHSAPPVSPAAPSVSPAAPSVSPAANAAPSKTYTTNEMSALVKRYLHRNPTESQQIFDTPEDLEAAFICLKEQTSSTMLDNQFLYCARYMVASKIFDHMVNAQNDANYQRFYDKFSELYHHNQAEIIQILKDLGIKKIQTITKESLPNLFKIITFALEKESELGASSSQPSNSLGSVPSVPPTANAERSQTYTTDEMRKLVLGCWRIRMDEFHALIDTQEGLEEVLKYLQEQIKIDLRDIDTTSFLIAQHNVANKIFDRMVNAQNDADYQRFYDKFSELYHRNQVEIIQILKDLGIKKIQTITKESLPNLFKIITFALEKESELGASSSQPSRA